MKKQTKLNDRWITFVKIVMDPWVLVLGISLVIVIRSLQDSEGFDINLFIILLIALISALLGGFFIKKWMDIHNEYLIINRGESSIKNLKLLYFNLLRVEKRIKTFIKKLDEKDPSYELHLTFFEELLDKCKILQEECITSISSWSDVIRDADAKTMLTRLNKLKERKNNITREIFELKKNFFESDAGERGTEEQFHKQLDQREFDLKELTKQITDFENRINESILSGMTGTMILKEANNSLSNFRIQEN